MVNCTFCGYEITPTTGKMYVKKDGKVLNFCSSKCERSQIKLKRVGRRTKWTKTFRDLKAAGKKTAEKKEINFLQGEDG